MRRKDTQEFQRQTRNSAGIYCFMDVVAKEAEEYAADHTSPMSALLEEVEHFTLTRTPYPSMLTGRVDTDPSSYEAIVTTTAGLVTEAESALAQNGTVGIGIPGTISARTGYVKNANTNALNGHFPEMWPSRI